MILWGVFIETGATNCLGVHDDGIKWKHFPRYWPFVWGIHQSPINFPHKGQWRGVCFRKMFPFDDGIMWWYFFRQAVYLMIVFQQQIFHGLYGLSLISIYSIGMLSMILILAHLSDVWAKLLRIIVAVYGHNICMIYGPIMGTYHYEYCWENPNMWHYRPFSLTMFACNSKSIENSLLKFSYCPLNHIFRIPSEYTVLCARFWSEHFIRIWLTAKWNFHRIWIVMEKLLAKWTPGYHFRIAYGLLDLTLNVLNFSEGT